MSIKRGLSRRFRSRRDIQLRQIIASCPRQGDELRILDVGGRPEYWKRVGLDFLARQNARITLLNLHAGELTEKDGIPDGMMAYVVGNGCALDYADGHFDLCHSNSVIEHVGLWPAMEDFARETRRAASVYYVQTPNFWFPIDPHFWRVPLQHWLPHPVRAWLMRIMPLATAGRAPDLATAYSFVDSSILLTRAQMRVLFPDATIKAERLFLLAKSHIAIRTAR